jgi:hypothetical protein
VALSFVVTALVARGSAGTRSSPGRVLPLGPLASVLWGAGRLLGLTLLGLVLYAGLAGDPHPMRNVVPTLVWVVWWVGLSLVVALVGNAWPALDPWRTLFDGAEALARRATGGRGISLGWAYPRGLGMWPAVAFLLAFAWCELVYTHAAVPRRIACLALAWSVLTLAGMACFGRQVWQERADVFAIYFATLGRFAPLGAGPDGRSVVLRPLGRGLIETEGATPGLVAFVLALLSTVLFDGLLGTTAWRLTDRTLSAWIPGLLDSDGYVLATTGLITVWLLLLGAYLAACRSTERLVPAGGGPSLAARFALTLAPIAIAYSVAHNLAYLLVRGQELIPLISDPLGRGWDLFGSAGWSPDLTLVGARFEWYVAVGAVVAGHVVSIWLAHRVMLRLVREPRRAVLASLPLILLMVGYTALSLWVIADPLVRFRTPDPSSRSEPDDEVDLHGASEGKRGHADRGPRGKPTRREVAGVLRVHGGIVGEVGEVDPGHHRALEARARAAEHGLEVAHYLARLGHGAAGHQGAGPGIHAELAGDEEIVAGADGMAVGRGGGRRGRIR